MGIITTPFSVKNREKKYNEKALVDTGARRSMIIEKELKELGFKPIISEQVDLGGEVKKEINLYLVNLKIGRCAMSNVLVWGGKKNIVGRDILQQNGAQIDESNDKVTFPFCSGKLEMDSFY